MNETFETCSPATFEDTGSVISSPASEGGAMRSVSPDGPTINPCGPEAAPCQPFSEAGLRRGADDPRHLWPQWFRLIRECRPPIVFGEQVPEAIKLGWLDDVSFDLEGEGYAIGAAVLSACVVEARQERERLWFVARSDRFAPQWTPKSWLERNPWPSDKGMARVAHGIPEQPFTRRAYGDAIIPRAGSQFIATALFAIADVL